MKLYSLYDKTAIIYNRPFMERSHATALRGLRQEVNRTDPTNNLFNSPKDYALFHIADFDEETGIVSPVTPPALIAEASALINPTTDKE